MQKVCRGNPGGFLRQGGKDDNLHLRRLIEVADGLLYSTLVAIVYGNTLTYWFAKAAMIMSFRYLGGCY